MILGKNNHCSYFCVFRTLKGYAESQRGFVESRSCQSRVVSSLSAVRQALQNGRENPVLEVNFVQLLTVPQKTFL